MTDANLALTFLSVAETTKDAETAARKVHNARKAYESVQHLRPKFLLTDAEAITLDARLAEVKLRLVTLEEKL